MFGLVTEETILEVLKLRNAVAATGYHKTKKEFMLTAAAELTPAAASLFTLSCWLCLFNPRFYAVDASAYYAVPASDVNQARLEDFLALLRHYESVRITTKREAVLSKFLQSCSREVADFFLLLLSGEFIKKLPLAEVQEAFDLDSIIIDEIYTHPVAERSLFAGLEFPVLARAVEPGELNWLRMRKTPHATLLKTDAGEKVKPSKALRQDLYLAQAPVLTMHAVTGASGVLYPYDYAGPDSPEDGLGGYAGRAADLSDFLDNNLLTGISPEPVVLLNTIEDLHAELPKIVPGPVPGQSRLLLTDGYTRSTGVHHNVDCRLVSGIIEDLWIERERARGFRIWFNGKLQHCSFLFSGKNNSLLHHNIRLQGKQISFYLFACGGVESFIGHEVQWQVRPWRVARLRGERAYIEKCVLCGDTRWIHASRGLCKSCECNLPIWFRRYGADVWINNVAKMADKRYRSGWSSSLLETAHIIFRGHYLEAAADGAWRFKPDSEAKAGYQRWKAKQRDKEN